MQISILHLFWLNLRPDVLIKAAQLMIGVYAGMLLDPHKLKIKLLTL